MKKNIFLVILTFLTLSLLTVSELEAQDKISLRLQNEFLQKKSETYTVWIFFTDKGENIKTKMLEVEKNLPPNALKRRKKCMKNRNIVTYNDIPVSLQYTENLNISKKEFRHKSAWLNAVSAEISEQKIREIEKLNFVKKIDLVNKFRKKYALEQSKSATKSNFKQNNIYNYGNSYAQMKQISVPTAHDMGFTGEGIKICILDAGYNNLEHPAFSSLNVLATYDFVNNDENVDDQIDDAGQGDHGTMTLSTIAGFEEGQLIGPAFGAEFILAKTENTESETEAEEDNWVAAMEWAENNYGPDLSTSSLGYLDWYEVEQLDGNTAAITIAADYAASIGILVVNSAGNEGDGTTTISAPADGDSVLTVGAVDSLGERAGFSSVGPTADGRIKPDIMAMGYNVYVAEVSGNDYKRTNGTSFSCPIAAGAAALLLQMVPEATNMDIVNALKQTADNNQNPNNLYGMGLIDVMRAYYYLIPHIVHDSLPDTETPQQTFTIEATITSFYGLVSNSPTLHYKFKNEAWQTVTMENIGENKYSAEILANNQTGDYKYYISATSDHRTESLPENAPNNYFTFSVGSDITKPRIFHKNIKEYYENLWSQAKILCTMTDNVGISAENCTIEWKINSVPQDNLSFSAVGNNTYKAVFNNENVRADDLIEYRIVAQDVAQNPNQTILPTDGYFEFYITDNIGFEENNFSHNWDFSGGVPWSIVMNGADNSMYCAKSGQVGDYGVSSMSIKINTLEAGNVSFYHKNSSENNADFMKFYIDDEVMGEWAGEIDWTYEEYYLAEGEHNLAWKYEKDAALDLPQDCAWLDLIKFPKSTTLPDDENTQEFVLDFGISPNPVSNTLYINVKTPINFIKCIIFDVNGRKIKSVTNQTQINVSELKNGIYFIQIETNKGVGISKFIVN